MKSCLLTTLCLLAPLVLTSCKTREQAFSSFTRTDTLRLVSLKADTLREKDSIFVREYTRGDTIRLERTRCRTLYKVRLLRDTVFKTTTDTIRIKETRQTPSVSPTSKLRPALSGAFVAFLVSGAVYVFYKLKK